MNIGKSTIAVMLALSLVFSAMAMADEPATRPAGIATGGGGGGGPVRAFRALGVARVNGVRPYTQQEWDDMMEFLRVNSPSRWAVLGHAKLPENMRLDLIRKWRNYNFVKDQFPAVADVQLQRFHKEDDLFSLALEAQSYDVEDPVLRSRYAAVNNQLRELIRGKVAELVQLGFKERQLRIDKLQQMLTEETQKLSQDQSAEEQTVDKRVDAIMKRIQRNAAANNPARPAPTTQPGPRSFLDGAPGDGSTVVQDVADSVQSIGRLAALAVSGETIGPSEPGDSN